MATGTIDARGMLNKPACLSVNHGDKATRYFHGIVAEFGPLEQSGTVDTLYRMILVPQLAQAGIRSDCRLFFNKTAEDILKIIFNDAGVTKTAFRLYSAPTQRKATAQFNETSLHFATRLMEEEGWYLLLRACFRRPHAGRDQRQQRLLRPFPAPRFVSASGTTADMLTEFRKPEALTVGKVSLQDYDFDVPDKNLKVDQNTVLKHGGTANRAVFHWPALTRDTGAGEESRAEWRMEAAEAAVSLIGGGGDHGEPDRRREVQVARPTPARRSMSSARSRISPRTYRAARGAARAPAPIRTTSPAFPNTVPWRQPMATARPRMEGLHTAIVLAPSGEEIHTDDQGRIKIRFFWDWREDATADNSEWVRVVQPWAGNQWGGQFIPRVDTEVAVAFMDADPDRPIVIGGLYNGNDKPIFPVAEKTKLGFRSRSVTKGGTDDFNEFSFDDKKGKRNGLSACAEGHEDRGRERPDS